MRKQASQLDVLSIKRKISSINANIDDSDIQVLTKLDEINTAVLSNTSKSTKEVQVDFTSNSANSDDFKGLYGIGSWDFPYVADRWYSTVDITGKGEVNWISFSSNRGSIFTAETGKSSSIKCTIDGVELFNKSTTFASQDSSTSREYVLLGACVGTTRLVQNKIYFSESLLIEVYSEYSVAPKPSPYINYQLY